MLVEGELGVELADADGNVLFSDGFLVFCHDFVKAERGMLDLEPEAIWVEVVPFSRIKRSSSYSGAVKAKLRVGDYEAVEEGKVHSLLKVEE